MEIKEDIIKTICIFDVLDRAVSDKEIHLYLFKSKADIKKIRTNLRKMIGNELSRKGQLYCLKGREKLFEIYKERKKFSKKKWRKTKFVGFLLRIVPYIKGVAVSQNLAINNAKEKSDIDLFIITSNKGLWISRLFTNILLDLFRLRNQKSKSFVCPNFLVSKDGMNLEKVALKPMDLDLARIIVTTRPLFGESIFDDFLHKNNWVKEYFPNCEELRGKRVKFIWVFWPLQKALELIFLPLIFFRKQIMNLQVRRLESVAKKAKNPMLRFDDQMAKIHYDDKRKEYLVKWEKLVSERT